MRGAIRVAVVDPELALCDGDFTVRAHETLEMIHAPESLLGDVDDGSLAGIADAGQHLTETLETIVVIHVGVAVATGEFAAAEVAMVMFGMNVLSLDEQELPVDG